MPGQNRAFHESNGSIAFNGHDSRVIFEFQNKSTKVKDLLRLRLLLQRIRLYDKRHN